MSVCVCVCVLYFSLSLPLCRYANIICIAVMFILICPCNHTTPHITHSVQKLFASLPHKLPSYMRQKPRCTDIVELPYSMAAMDHLEPIMYRTTLRTNKQLGERGLRKVGVACITACMLVDSLIPCERRKPLSHALGARIVG